MYSELSYLDLKKVGWAVFPKMAGSCLAMNTDSNTEKTPYRIVVLWLNAEAHQAMILVDKDGAINATEILQNVNNELNLRYRFMDISRNLADRQTIESFLQDAKELSDKRPVETENVQSDTDAIARAKQMVSDAIKKRASDIHLVVEPNGARTRFRVDGEMESETQGYHKLEAREMVSALLQNYSPGFSKFESDSRNIQAAIQLPVDTGLGKLESVTLRMDRTGSADREGYKATFRIQLTDRPHMPLEEAGYEDWMTKKLKTIFDAPYGIFIVTGKVNSGKSTTNHALLEGISHAKSGLSIEDPIEFKYTHPNITPIQVNKDDPDGTLEAHLRSSLRKDPDFVNVAEIRSAEVAELVLGHARVGCVMSSTLHTNDAVTAFDRLCELNISPKELANIDLFLGVMSQRLVRKLCPHCSTPFTPSHLSDVIHSPVHSHNPNGCEHCYHGYVPGRTAVAELLIPEDDDAQFIRDEEWMAWRKHLLGKGFKTMALRALQLTQQKAICFADAMTNIPGFANVATQLKHYQPSDH